jgi:hypothetical protein
MVVLPVAIAEVLNTRALCHLTFVLIGAITVAIMVAITAAIAVDVLMLLLAIILRAALGVA